MKLIAHRGGAAHWPENSLHAFQQAIAVGCAGAELDIRLSADQYPMVHHDARLNPAFCRDGNGHWVRPHARPRIADLSVTELNQFRIGMMQRGTAYARQFSQRADQPNQKVPLLSEVLSLTLAESDFLWVIELKSEVTRAAEPGWQLLLDTTLASVAKFPDCSTVFCGFDWNLLRASMQQSPQQRCWFTTHPLPWLGVMPTNPLTPEGSERRIKLLQSFVLAGNTPWFAGFEPIHAGANLYQSFASAIAATGGSAWFAHHSDITPELVQACHQAGLLACAWSALVSDPAEYRRLEQCGVDMFCTDDIKATHWQDHS